MTKQKVSKDEVINLKEFMRVDPNYIDGVFVGVEDQENVKLISTRVFPELWMKLKGFSKYSHVTQQAVINAALIRLIDEKEKEAGVKFEDFAEPPTKRIPLEHEILAALPEENKK